MSYEAVFGEYEPRNVLKKFYEVSQIPRGTGDMERISAHVLAWAEGLGLEAERDEVNNVLVRKPASKGMEKHETVALQAHMDMVCEKDEGVEHDFTKDPIDIYMTNGEIIRAKGTTLGGDDGIGMALIMAIFEDKTAVHPPLEAIFTVDEETDMKGAKNFDSGKLKAHKLINLDIGAIAVAGNGEAELRMHVKKEMVPVKEGSKCLKLKLSGLQGGHSGAQAMEERGNAISLLNRLLLRLTRTVNYQLISFIGGNDNSSSFARYAEAVIAVLPEHEIAVKESCAAMLCNYQIELEHRDPGVSISVEDMENIVSEAFSEETKDKLCTLLLLLPDGLFGLNKKWPGLMETASNVGVVKTREKEVYITMLARSFMEHRRHLLLDKAKKLCGLLQIEAEVDHDIAHWEYHISDEFLEKVKEIYSEFQVRIGQGTCELGVFTEGREDLEVVALSCPHHYPHSPQEYLLRSEIVASYNSLSTLLAKL